MPNKAIDDQIYGLKYDPLEVLTFNGEQVTNFIPKEGNIDNGNFTVITREKHDIDAGNMDISVPNSNKDVTYPGGLLLANSKLIDGTPQPLVTERAPINITIDLPGLTVNSKKVDKPDFASVSQATTELLESWYGKGNSTPSNIQLKSSLIYDEKQLQISFGCDVSFLKQKLGIDFKAISANKKSAYLVQYKQLYYTVSAELPKNPSDVFGDSVTYDNLVAKGVNSKNPPIIVENVQYGRQIYLCFESEMSQNQLEAKLNSKISKDGVDADIHSETSDLTKNQSITCKIIVLGGGNVTLPTGKIDDKDYLEQLNKIITTNPELSKSNPAYPLSYKTAFLKDNAPAKVSGTSSYVSTTSETFSKGNLILEHKGGYVASFHVDWEEINYVNGALVATHNSWPQNGKNLTAPFSTTIALPGNTRSINIKAEGATGLLWDRWRTSVNERNLAMVPLRTVKIWGVTLSQKGSVDPK